MHTVDVMLEAKRLMNRAAEAALRGEPDAAAMADRALRQLRAAQAPDIAATGNSNQEHFR